MVNASYTGKDSNQHRINTLTKYLTLRMIFFPDTYFLLLQRSLTDFLNKVHQNPAVQALSADEQALLDELLRAAQSHTLTPIIHREGYAKIIQLIEGGSLREIYIYM